MAQGFLEKAIKNGVSRAITNLVSTNIKNAVQPKAKKTSEKADKRKKTEENISETVNAKSKKKAEAKAEKKRFCPKCGTEVDGDDKFCPECGERLPEIAKEAVCPVCGNKNIPGASFCSECGIKLASEDEKAEKEQTDPSDADVMRMWSIKLSNYPKWCFGGSGYTLGETGKDDAGNPYYLFTAKNATSEMLAMYTERLKQLGFTRPADAESDETLYKVIAGKCYAFNQTEAFSDDGKMSIQFFIGDFE